MPTSIKRPQKMFKKFQFHSASTVTKNGRNSGLKF